MENTEKQETKILNEAEKLFNQGKLDEALQLIDLIPESSPNYGNALFAKSLILGISSDGEETFKTLKKQPNTEFKEDIVDLNKKYKPADLNNPEDLFNCGITSYYFGEYEKAIENFNLSLKKLPNQCEVIYYKALSYACMEELKKAVREMDKAIELQPRNSKYWNDKGAFLSELNQVAKAHKCFNKSIRLNPDSLNWSNKAVLYHKCNNLEKALECYDNAIELDSDDVYPIIGKAKVYMELEDIKNAHKYFDLAEKIDDRDLEFLIEKGKFMMYIKDYKKALKYFNKCLRFNDNLAFVLMFKSMALKKLNREYDADKCIEKALELDENILKKFNEMF